VEQPPPRGGQGREEVTHRQAVAPRRHRRPETTTLLLPVPQAPEALTQRVHQRTSKPPKWRGAIGNLSRVAGKTRNSVWQTGHKTHFRTPLFAYSKGPMWREAVVSGRFCALFHRRLGQRARKWRVIAMKRAPETAKNDAQTATG
jgi:hypothetical protein